MELFALFDLKVKYVSGSTNTIADSLSRNPMLTEVSQNNELDSSDDSVDKELAAINLQPEEEGNHFEWTAWIRAAQNNDPYVQGLVQPRSQLYTKR